MSMKSLRFRHLVAVISIVIIYVSCDTTDTAKPGEDKSLVTPAQPVKEVVSSKTKKKKSVPVQHTVKISAPVSFTARLGDAKDFVQRNGYSMEYCFLIDMSIKSGKNRFFVYNLETNTVLMAGLTAHGSCNTQFISQARFSNAMDCGCSSQGKYKVGSSYMGEWGKSFRLYGLDNSNSNAFKRGIVIHAHDGVPDEEIYPRVLVNSYGCPMVSHSFFAKLSKVIEGSDKPILLWIFE